MTNTVFTPDDFRTDWYGWLTNQVSHIGLGMAAAGMFCFIYLIIMDEFPVRKTAWFLVAICYTLYELRKQRWQGFDTIEDIIFVAGYGAGGLLYTLREVNTGTGDFTGNIWDVAPFFILAAVHLTLGISWRVFNWWKSERLSND